MSIRTIYKCDKCGNEQATAEQFWTVGVSAKHHMYGSNNDFVAGKSLEVCRPCLESFGIHVQKKPGETTPSPVPSVEDLIREIIQRCQE